ncbi:hypothetical protein CLF_112334 [Clonorchis sinensis]|uniref:Ribonuclease H2 subunit B wHTH domain-containing protein n=1 Tax=Clonorchis sinensis TaxID=79923 RepID=G7YW80_CLOSI|nr:hypothetical protein CLF_112334 [Clonorchis sinensis]
MGAMHVGYPVDHEQDYQSGGAGPAQHHLTKYTALNALLVENGDLSTVLAELPNFESRLLFICDTTVVGSQTLYRYSKDRALEWLSCKVNKLAESLSRLDDASAVQQIKLATNVTSSTGSVDAKAPDFALDSTEAKSVSDTKLSPKTCQKFAYQLVADYLVPDLAADLSSMLGLKSSCLGTLENVDPQASEAESVSNGASLFDCSSLVSDTPEVSQSSDFFWVGGQPPATKKLKLASKGTKSIMSFFTKQSN